MKTIVVISDMQIPYHDKRAITNVAAFIKAYKPDSVVCVGDVLDSPQVSRWNKGMAGEFFGKLHKDRDEAVRIMESLKIQHLSRSNHDERIETYLKKYAPGLADDPDFRIERYFRLDSLGVTFHRKPYELAPGWLLCHGDEGNLVQSPGGTALSLARRTGKSVCAGHTHRLGLQPHSEGFNGRITRTIYGFEVGNLMDLRGASYLKSGGANWQQGFGILLVEGSRVTPVPVPVHRDGSFVVDRKVWG